MHRGGTDRERGAHGGDVTGSGVHTGGTNQEGCTPGGRNGEGGTWWGTDQEGRTPPPSRSAPSGLYAKRRGRAGEVVCAHPLLFAHRPGGAEQGGCFSQSSHGPARSEPAGI